jgi:hypothetical protein
MKHIYLIILLFFGVNAVVHSEDTVLEKTAHDLIEQLQQNPLVSYELPDQGTSVSMALILKVPKVENENVRSGIVDYCVRVEQLHPTHALYKTRSSNQALLTELIRSFEQTGKNSGAILNLYTPTDIAQYADRIRAKIYSTKNRDISLESLALYAVIPSNDPAEVKEYISKLIASPDVYKYHGEVNPILLGILARYGDTKSEESLLKYAENCGTHGSVGHTLVSDLEQSLVIASTTRVKKMMAEGLRKTEIIETPGNLVIPRCEVYARVLNKIFRDDPTYPFPDKKFLEWKEYGILEKWCEKYLGIKVTTPFPDVPPTPTPATK